MNKLANIPDIATNENPIATTAYKLSPLVMITSFVYKAEVRTKQAFAIPIKDATSKEGQTLE